MALKGSAAAEPSMGLAHSGCSADPGPGAPVLPAPCSTLMPCSHLCSKQRRANEGEARCKEMSFLPPFHSNIEEDDNKNNNRSSSCGSVG